MHRKVNFTAATYKTQHFSKEHKQGENAVTYLQANKTHTTSIQDQDEPPKKYIGRRDTSTHISCIQTEHKETFYIRLILIWIRMI
jgi:hypothetical protein